jgi:hypothetical protein
MSMRRDVRWLLVAFGPIVVSCGSRTPLEINPTDASTTRDAGDDAADSADSSVDVNDAQVLQCFTGSRPVGPIPIDLYFALDRSKSMDTVDRGATLTRWEAISAAMNTFINAPLSAGLGAGLMFFPRNSSGGSPLCTTGDYAFPVVPVGTLPGVAPSITKAISLQTRAQGTPMTPALQGAHVYMRTEQQSQPTHTAAVVVVTDGVPRDCGSTLPATAAVAAAATTGMPLIRTYVLGVGPNLSNLNTIAQAGGTSQAYLVEAAGEGSLLAALEAIRTSALACELAIPPTSGGPMGLDNVRVTTVLGNSGEVTSLDRVDGAQACAGGPGWFFDSPPGGDNPPTKILLCPESCDPLVKSTGNALNVAIGCPSQ